MLRIEDTDAQRSSEDMVAGIVDGLRWLGLDWDEGPDVGGPHAPYFQSQRLDRHRAEAERLVQSAAAYYCYCDPDDLKAMREAAEAQGAAWRYDRRCVALSETEIEARERAGAARAIRFKVPPGETAFDDLVHGRIAFDNANIEDFVILRSDRQPTYHLSVVVDDIDMRITEVVRGDDHISNTPKQVLLYQALGAELPRFAHVPLILGPDRKRLSKRHGATSVTEYQRQGYLPEAMVNFLALLGWSPGDDRELFAMAELIAVFSLGGISGGNAVFNPEKLDWFNSQHILRIEPRTLVERLEPVLQASGLWRDAFRDTERTWLERVIELLKPRVRRLHDFVDQGRPFLAESVEYDPAAVAKHLATAEGRRLLDALRETLGGLEPFEAPALESAIRTLAEQRQVKAATLIHVARVAVTGRTVSPGLFETLELVGRERVLARLEAAARPNG